MNKKLYSESYKLVGHAKLNCRKSHKKPKRSATKLNALIKEKTRLMFQYECFAF